MLRTTACYRRARGKRPFSVRSEARIIATSPRYCRLAGTGCIEVGGADATDFLNSQLSQALDRVGAGVAPLAAWHDPRGRVRALFRALRTADGWRLLTARDGLEAALERLNKFVLRAEVTLAPAGDVSAVALLDMEPSWLEARGLSVTAARDAAAVHDAVRLVHVGRGLWQGVGARAALERLTADLARVEETAATLAEIRLGVPRVTPANAERYVGQMLNLDVLGAIAFDKGCYPGQEVIARVRNLGSVKRRMRRFASDSATVPDVGAELVDADGTAVGEVLRAAPAEPGAEILAVVEHSARDRPLLTHDSAHWHLEPLPYEVPSQ